MLLNAAADAQCPEQNLGSGVPISVTGSTLPKPNLVDPAVVFREEQFLCISDAPEATFLYTPPFSGRFRIDTFGSEFDTLLYTLDPTCDELSASGCADDVLPSLQSELVVDLFEGEPIVIVLDGFGTSAGAYQLNIDGVAEATATPTFDEGMATPTPVLGDCPVNDLGSAVPAAAPIRTTSEVSRLSSPTCGGDFSPEVTFAFTAPSAGIYAFAADGSEAIYIRDDGCGGAELACGVFGAVASATMAAGQRVAVIVESRFATLLVYKQTDQCPLADLGDSVPATAAYDPALGLADAVACCASPCGPEATFAFTAPETASYLISTHGSSDDTQLLIRSQCDSPILNACNDDAPFSLQSEVTVDLQEGENIQIAVQGAVSTIQLNVVQGTPTPRPTPPALALRAYVANELDGAVSVISVPPRTGLLCDDLTPCAAGQVCVAGSCLIAPLLLGNICFDQISKPESDFFPRALRISRDGNLAYIGGRLAFKADGERASRYELVIADTAFVDEMHPRACVLGQLLPAVRQLNFSIAELVLALNELSLFVAAQEKNALAVLPNPIVDASAPGSAIPVGRNPSDAALSPNGSVAYVSNADDGTLSILRLDDATRSTVTVGTRPAALAVSPDGTLVFVANTGSDTVSVIEAGRALSEPSSAVIATVAVGSRPLGLAVTAGGDAVWVVNAGDDSVSIIDVASLPAPSVDTVAGVGEFPARIALTPDDEFAYLTNLGSGRGDGFVSVIDAQARSVLPFRVPVGRLPLAIEIPPPPPTFTPTPTATATETGTVTPTARPCQTGADCLADAPLCIDSFCLAATATVTATRSPSRTATRTGTKTAGPVDPPECCGTIDCGFAPYECDCDLTCHAIGGDCAVSDRCIAPRMIEDATATPTVTPSVTPTPSGTHTPTRTQSVTPSPSRTWTRTRTRTPTASASPTLTGMPPGTLAATSTATAGTPTPCPGDCDRGGSVVIAELILAVGIALERQPVSACPAADLNNSASVTIEELMRAVNAALNGCEIPP